MSTETKATAEAASKTNGTSLGRWLSGHWRAARMAVGFLTRIPVGSRVHTDAEALARCPIYFALVGMLIGAATAGLIFGGSLIWPFWLAVIVAMAVELLITGAFHEDAVADFFDAFGGGWTREDVLRILKDSRIGTYGTVALVATLALRGGAMMALVYQYGLQQWQFWFVAIVASAAIGRWAILLTMRLLPPVSDRESLSRDLARRITWCDLMLGTFWVLPASVALAWSMPIPFAACVVLLLLLVGLFIVVVRSRIGGVTGDCLGCICYLSQITVLLVAAGRWESWIGS